MQRHRLWFIAQGFWLRLRRAEQATGQVFEMLNARMQAHIPHHIRYPVPFNGGPHIPDGKTGGDHGVGSVGQVICIYPYVPFPLPAFQRISAQK